MKFVCVTSCITGIAHTYMAAEALEQAGKKLGVSTERARQLEERALRKLSQRPELIALREAA